MLEQLFRGKRMAEVVEALADKFGDDNNLAETDKNKLFEIFAPIALRVSTTVSSTLRTSTRASLAT